MPFYSISHGFSRKDSGWAKRAQPYIPEISKDEYLLSVADLVKDDNRIFIMKYRSACDTTKYLAFLFNQKNAIVFKTKQALDTFIQDKISENYSLTKPIRQTYSIKVLNQYVSSTIQF